MPSVCRVGHNLDAQRPYYSPDGRRRCRECQNQWNRDYRARKRRQRVRESEEFAELRRLILALVSQNAAFEGRYIPDEETALLLERLERADSR